MADRGAVAGSHLLLTGPGGFIGRAAARRLEAADCRVRRAGRAVVGDIGPDTDWRAWLDGMDTVIHLAARVHVLRETAVDPQAAFDRVNCAATLRLARQAQAAGVRRFVFMSTIQVLGMTGRDLTPDAAPCPANPYAHSKHRAEQALQSLCNENPAGGDVMDLVILRPPLVYGPGVGGKFLRLMQITARGLPLPLGAVHNRRSLIYRENLADAILRALTAPPGIYHPCDMGDISTPDLIRRLARALDAPCRLFALPIPLLMLAGRVLGRRRDVQALTGDMSVDGAMPGEGWPPYGMDAGLAETASWFRRRGLRPGGGGATPAGP